VTCFHLFFLLSTTLVGRVTGAGLITDDRGRDESAQYRSIAKRPLPNSRGAGYKADSFLLKLRNII
jgi:hypothetical protein